MTTLSKEDVVRLAGSVGIDPMLLDAKQISHLESFANLARADLVAENERLKRSNSSYANLTKAQEGQLASLHLRLYELKGGDKSIDSERAANATLTEELATTRTALAAAEARETKLRAAIDVVLSDAEECEDHDGWLANLVSCEAIHQLDEAFIQPRDDSALREMIAGVYEECAKVCDLFEQKADALNDSIADDDDANKGRSEYIMGKATASSRIANAIRALEEKKLASLTS